MKTNFKNKNLTVLLLFMLLGIQVHAQWWTDSMNISTGYNHASHSVYSINCPSTNVDEYWSITQCPGLTNGTSFIPPFCAIPFNTNNTIVTDPSGIINPNISTSFRAISALCLQGTTSQAGPLGGVLWGCDGGLNVQSPAKYLRFTRRFYVQDSTNVNIKITDGFADNFCRMAIDAGANPIPAYTGTDASFYFLNTYSTYQLPNIVGSPIQHHSSLLHTGWHTLDIDLYDISGVEISLALTGTIYTDSSQLIYFAPNNLCAEPSAPIPAAIPNLNTKKNSLLIYPNPTSSYFTVSVDLPKSTKQASIQLTDVLGKIIKQQNFSNFNDNKLNVEIPNNVNNGVIYCSLIIDGKITKTEKVTVIR